MHKKVRDYSKIKLDLPTKILEPERRRIKSRVRIDRTVFSKTSEEKIRLKVEKAKLKKSSLNSTRKKRERLDK